MHRPSHPVTGRWRRSPHPRRDTPDETPLPCLPRVPRRHPCRRSALQPLARQAYRPWAIRAGTGIRPATHMSRYADGPTVGFSAPVGAPSRTRPARSSPADPTSRGRLVESPESVQRISSAHPSPGGCPSAHQVGASPDGLALRRPEVAQEPVSAASLRRGAQPAWDGAVWSSRRQALAREEPRPCGASSGRVRGPSAGSPRDQGTT